MAYEVNRRLVSREGQLKFSRGKRPQFPEGETDPEYDRYNRVLEGVVQIIKRTDYNQERENNQYGRIVENPWGYTEEAKKEIISNLTNDFTRFFFETIVSEVTDKVMNAPITKPESEQMQIEAEKVRQSI